MLEISTTIFLTTIEVSLSTSTVVWGGKTYPAEITEQSFKWRDASELHDVNRFDGSYAISGEQGIGSGHCETVAQRF